LLPDDKKNYSVFNSFYFYPKFKVQGKILPTKKHLHRACIINVSIGMVGNDDGAEFDINI
jgi:hypothetical protein